MRVPLSPPKYIVFLIFSLTLLTQNTRAMDYHVGFEADYAKVAEPSFFPILKAGLEDPTHDLEIKFDPIHPNVNAVSSRNFYWGTSDESTESGLRFSFGRRLIGWSSMDDMWQLGQIEPLDSWDRLRSFTQGLTGIFAYSETGSFRFRFFFSYLAIPETTPNVVIENQEFVSEHPQSAASAPQTLNLLNRPTPLGYSLDIPSLNKILFRPSFMFQIETKKNWPIYGKFVYGYLPLNHFPVALQASLALSLNQEVIILHPLLYHHHVYNGELSYSLPSNIFLGMNGLLDQPEAKVTPVDYTTSPLDTSLTLSPWLKFQFSKSTLLLSQIWAKGGVSADVGLYANPNTSIFSSRILYRNASQIELNQTLNDDEVHHPTLQIKGIHEYSIIANWIAADLNYHFERNFSGFIGGDFISADRSVSPDRGAEFLSDLQTNNRVRIGVNYVF